MYDVARFVKPKRGDYDNGTHECTDRADEEVFRQSRSESTMGDVARIALGQPCQHQYWNIATGIAWCCACGERMPNSY